MLLQGKKKVCHKKQKKFQPKPLTLIHTALNWFFRSLYGPEAFLLLGSQLVCSHQASRNYSWHWGLLFSETPI